MEDYMSKNKPTPVATVTVCSMCGLDWHSHGEDPTTEDCIRLLRVELARRPITINAPVVPYPVPWPVRPWNRGPYYGDVTVWSSSTSGANEHTPRLPATTCRAVSS